MGFPDDLFPASFRGIAFEFTDIRDTFGRRLDVKEFFRRDTPEVTDLGRAARRGSISGIVTSRMLAAGQSIAQVRRALIEAVERDGPARLVHPDLGEMYVRVEAAEIPHVLEEQDILRFSLDVVEDGESRFPAATVDTQARVASTAASVRTAIRDLFAAGYRVATLPGFVATAMTRVIDRVASAAGLARVVDDATAFAAEASALVTDGSALADLLIARFSTVPDLALPASVDRFIALARFGAPPDVARTSTVRVAQAIAQDSLVRLVRASAIIGAADTAAAARYDSEQQAETVREALREAVDEAILEASDQQDDATVRHLRTVFNAIMVDLTERAARLDRVIEVPVPGVVPVRVLANRIYGPENLEARTDDLLARNGVLHPAFVSGPVRALSR